MKISLILPAYNEEEIIETTLRKLNSFLKKERDEWEVIIVDDGSKDKTLNVLRNFSPKFFKILSYPTNKGKGFAIKKGVEKAEGDYICFIDSDLAYSLENLKELTSSLEKFDVVIGSRNLSTNNHENISVLRRILGRGFNIISNIILGYNIPDTQCGLKTFRREVAKDIFSKQTLNGFSFDTEVLYIAKKRNHKIKQKIAVVSKDHQSKDSKMNLLVDPPKMFLDLVKIRLNDLRGIYG